MTQQDIGILLELKMQSQGYFLSGSLEPEEIDLILDSHTDNFIDEVLTGLRNKGSFESNVVRLGELRSLKKTSGELSPSDTTIVGQVGFTVPTDYRDYIRILPQVNADCLESAVYKKARVIQEDIVNELLDDTYHKSTITSPVSTIEGDTVIVYLNEFTCSKLKLTYIKKPDNFDIKNKASDEYPLPKSAINRIIDKAALELMKILEQKGEKVQSLQQDKLL